MTPEEHQTEHIRLHRALDELLACYFTENISIAGNKRSSIRDPILNLLEWAYQKTMLPSPAPEESHGANARDHADFEAERQMIVLALAELALSRPGFEDAIKQIVRNFDSEGLLLFEAFKQTNRDRVKFSHGALS
jgi:hypothetical protein